MGRETDNKAINSKKKNTKKSAKKTTPKNNIAKKSASIFSKVTIKVAMYIIGAVILVLVCKSTYDFGTKIFSEEGIAEKGKGHDVVVTIPADASTGEVASILKNNGLIESELIFKIQTILYEADIYSGTYTLNTEYNPEELIEAMKPEKEE